MTRVSSMVAMDWDSLAGLLDIPYEKREEMKTNHVKFPDSTSKAEEVLQHFNESNRFDRDDFRKCVDELGRHDVMKKLHPMENEVLTTQCFENSIVIFATIIAFINSQFRSIPSIYAMADFHFS